MIHQMNNIIKSKQIDQFWPNVSLITEQIVDACRRSINKDGSLVEFQKGQLWFEMKNTGYYNNISNFHNNNNADKKQGTK